MRERKPDEPHSTITIELFANRSRMRMVTTKCGPFELLDAAAATVAAEQNDLRGCMYHVGADDYSI